MSNDVAGQSVSELTEQFGIPGVLLFREEGGLVFAEMTSPAAKGSLCLQGAHLTAWQPAGEKQVLWMSDRSEVALGKAIRGGVPLLFPWFGPRHDGKEGPSHGFGRTQTWRLDFAAIAGDDVTLTLTLGPTELSRTLGFDRFRLAYRVSLGRELRMQLAVANEGDAALVFEEGMHTYFAVSDIHGITVSGLDGTTYLDKKDEGKQKPQVAGPMHITAPTDRVYLDTQATCVVRDPGYGRQITVAKGHSDTTVVWNPWADMADIQPEGWHGFVCVETVNVGDAAVTLLPGATHTMESQVSVGPLSD